MSRWLKDQRGATAIEYALIASLISIVVVVGAAAVGTGTNGLYTRVQDAFNTYLP